MKVLNQLPDNGSMGSGRNSHEALCAWALWLSVVATVTCASTPLKYTSAQEPARSSSAGAGAIATVAYPVFEVATIRASRPGGRYPSINTHLRDLSVTNATVLDLLKWSYRLRDEQIKGGPAWMSETKFDIVAQPDLASEPSRDQDRLMMQKLLAERFHLRVHETQRVSSVYALSLGEGHPRMVPSNPQDGHVHIYSKRLDDDTTAVQFSFATMPDLLYTLMDSIKDHQIVDETGLKGEYDFTLVVPSATLEGDADPGDLNAALLQAVQSIGLQLKRKKAPIRVIVIDHLDLPTAN